MSVTSWLVLALRLGFLSFIRRGWRLVLIIVPAALLFAMLTMAIATRLAIHHLTSTKDVVHRALRIGSVPGYRSAVSSYTDAEIRALSNKPGVMAGAALFEDCNVDPSKPVEFTCAAANRTYVEIHDFVLSAARADLDRWDATKSGALVVPAPGNPYHWKVGDSVVMHIVDKGDIPIVISGILDKSVGTSTVYFHREYYEQIFGPTKYWVVWLLVDRPENRQAVLDKVEEDLSSIHRPHTTWKGEDTVTLLLNTSEMLRLVFGVAGFIALVLVVALSMALLIISMERRTIEIATMLALGFRRWTMAASILAEGILIMTCAAALGAFVDWLPFHATPLPFDFIVGVRVPTWLALSVAASGVLFGLLTAAIPAWRTFRLDTLTGLRT